MCVHLFRVVCLFMLSLNAYLVACVKEFDGVLAGWPSAVLCDGSQPICYCRHRAVILPALALSLFLNYDLSNHYDFNSYKAL